MLTSGRITQNKNQAQAMAWGRIQQILAVIVCLFVAYLIYKMKAYGEETVDSYMERTKTYGGANVNEKNIVNTSSHSTRDNISVASNGGSRKDQKLYNNLTSVIDLSSTGNVHSIWPNDSLCSRFNVKFSSGLPLIWLASFPRSGNTWTRYLIEASTGVWTNSIYNDKTNIPLGYLGEMEHVGTGRCVVTKTHIWKRMDYVPSILVIRNPAKSIVSFWNFHKAPRKFQGSNIFFYNVAKSTYKTEEFRRWVTKNTKLWRNVTETYLKHSQKLLVIIYEELCTDPITHIHRILEFLGLQGDSARMACLTKYIDGNAKGRQREIFPYTLEEKSNLRQAIDVVRRAAHQRGVELPKYERLL